MNTPHKHRDFIIAWANGTGIEYYNENQAAWVDCCEPVWSENIAYRIKKDSNQLVLHKRISRFACDFIKNCLRKS